MALAFVLAVSACGELRGCSDKLDGHGHAVRKYEGQLTDEKDAHGHPVKVTMASFARHAGIARTTFQERVDREDADVDRQVLNAEKRGRTVKVTRASFARHLGIEQSTFRLWMRDADGDEDDRSRSREVQAQARIRSEVRNRPEAVVQIMDAPT